MSEYRAQASTSEKAKHSHHRRRIAFAASAVMLTVSSILAVKERDDLAAKAFEVIGELSPIQLPLSADRYAAMRTQLRESTVTLWQQSAESELPSRICTATKVRNGTRNYILTAAHCFEQDPDLKDQSRHGKTEDAFKYTNTNHGDRYMIADPTPNRANQNKETLLAEVTDSATSSQDDWALLEVTPYSDKSREKAYTSIPALPLDAYTTVGGTQPEPGEQVAIVAQPAVATNPIEARAYYIGRRAVEKNGRKQRYDIIGMNVTSQTENPCQPGSSGSQGIAASGVILGPLTDGPRRPMETSESVEYGQQFGLPLTAASYNLVCQYTAATADMVQLLEHKLAA